MDQWLPQTQKLGTQRSNQLQIGDCVQTQQSCPVAHTNTNIHKKSIVTQTAASAVLSWQTTVPILPLLAVQPVDTTVNLGRGDGKERHFGRDARFPQGPKAVPARHYCQSQRSWRKAWRHYCASPRRHGPVNCDNQEEQLFFFFERGLTIIARLYEIPQSLISQSNHSRCSVKTQIFQDFFQVTWLEFTALTLNVLQHNTDKC